MKLRVFFNAHGQRHFVGLLEEKTTPQGLTTFFEYSPDFLGADIPLSPFMLPLRPGVFQDAKCTFDGLFGVFNDSLPDGWGLLLLDRALRKESLVPNSITPLQRLARGGTNSMGALEYEPECEQAIMPTNSLYLDTLAHKALNILCEKDTLPQTILELLQLNGSSAGARPKILVMVSPDKKTVYPEGIPCNADFEPWIIKFPASVDDANIGLTEYRYSLMAKAAGLKMPETHLFASHSTAGFFGVKRFDRCKGIKIHTHTACGLLHASHRHASLDYENLLRLTQVLTKNKHDVEMMFRLMTFNIKAGNKDDHSKNFSFMLIPASQGIWEWRLAPAYDLTPAAGFGGEHTALVNGKGRDINTADLLIEAEKTGIHSARAKEIIEQVNEAVHCTVYNQY